MTKFIIATNNKNKVAELTLFVKMHTRENTEILTLKDLSIDIDVKEGTTSLTENAIKKAKDSYRILLEKELINHDDYVIAEDSGLFGVRTGYPGVITKREMECIGMGNVLENIRKEDNSNAYYKSVVAVFGEGDKLFISEGYEYGKILQNPIGEFNYPLDKFFDSNIRGPLGKVEPEEFTKTSFRVSGTIERIE